MRTPRQEKNTPLTKHRVRRVLDTLRGQRVIGRNDEDGYYYPGKSPSCVVFDVFLPDNVMETFVTVIYSSEYVLGLNVFIQYTWCI